MCQTGVHLISPKSRQVMNHLKKTRLRPSVYFGTNNCSKLCNTVYLNNYCTVQRNHLLIPLENARRFTFNRAEQLNRPQSYEINILHSQSGLLSVTLSLIPFPNVDNSELQIETLFRLTLRERESSICTFLILSHEFQTIQYTCKTRGLDITTMIYSFKAVN